MILYFYSELYPLTLSIYLKFVHSFAGRRIKESIPCGLLQHSFCLKHAFQFSIVKVEISTSRATTRMLILC